MFIPFVILGGAPLATCKSIVVSWWGGKEPSKGNLLHEDYQAAGAIVAVSVSMMENTQITEEFSTTWLNFIIKSSTKTSLVDLYSPNGKHNTS